YPNGADAPAVAHEVTFNTAILLDADSVFHGVDRVFDPGEQMVPLKSGMRLDFAGDGAWVVHDDDREVTRYAWEELRFSVSWKASATAACSTCSRPASRAGCPPTSTPPTRSRCTTASRRCSTRCGRPTSRSTSSPRSSASATRPARSKPRRGQGFGSCATPSG